MNAPSQSTLSAPTPVEVSWALNKGAGRIGTGDWSAFPIDRLDNVLRAAEDWRQALAGVERPWLCWCVDEAWCELQQRLVRAVGWTPIVGTDGRHPAPRLVEGAKFVDFNARLGLPVMWMHFALEFVFAFTDKLAFWHSDMLPPVPVVREVAAGFERLEDGQTSAVTKERVTLSARLRRWLKGRPPGYRRYFEVIGCTTAGASRSQFDHGCGWWRRVHLHPHVAPHVAATSPHWEHGVGIYLWKQYFGGSVVPLPESLERYHYSSNRDVYRKGRSKADALNQSFNLREIEA